MLKVWFWLIINEGDWILIYVVCDLDFLLVYVFKIVGMVGVIRLLIK